MERKKKMKNEKNSNTNTGNDQNPISYGYTAFFVLLAMTTITLIRNIRTISSTCYYAKGPYIPDQRYYYYYGKSPRAINTW